MNAVADFIFVLTMSIIWGIFAWFSAYNKKRFWSMFCGAMYVVVGVSCVGMNPDKNYWVISFTAIIPMFVSLMACGFFDESKED